jgi:peptidoglycan/LPS O-acetylase OafA/YrhL
MSLSAISGYLLQSESHEIIKIVVGSPLLFNLQVYFVIIVGLILSKRESRDDFFGRGLTDTAKGLAIFGIIVQHLCWHAVSDQQALATFKYLGTKGVAVFLILSGYGLSSSYFRSGMKNFFKKKLLKIYVVFLIANLILMSVEVMLFSSPISTIDFIKQATGIKTVDINYWFINFLFFWYLTFFIVYNLQTDTSVKIIVLFLCSLFVVFSEDMTPNAKLNLLSFPAGVLMFEYKDRMHSFVKAINVRKSLLPVSLFVAGVIVYGGVETWIDRHLYIYLMFFVVASLIYVFYRPPVVEFASCLVVLFIGCSFAYSSQVSDSMWYSVKNVAISGLALLVLQKMYASRSSFLFSFLGRHSLELFLVHGFFMYSHDYILYKGDLTITFWIYLLIISVLSVMIKKLAAGIVRLA